MRIGLLEQRVRRMQKRLEQRVRRMQKGLEQLHQKPTVRIQMVSQQRQKTQTLDWSPGRTQVPVGLSTRFRQHYSKMLIRQFQMQTSGSRPIVQARQIPKALRRRRL
jgi:hypothetical protein